MRLVWAIIPLVLFGVIGISEADAKTSDNISNISENGLELFLFTNKTTYHENEPIHIVVDVKNTSLLPQFVPVANSCEVKTTYIDLRVTGNFETFYPPVPSSMCFPAEGTLSLSPLETFGYDFVWEEKLIPGTYTILVWTIADLETSLEFIILADNTQSPKQQFDRGIFPYDVNCQDELKLIFKPNDILPYCVSDKTFEKLSTRGWSGKFSTPLEVLPDKEIYSIGERVEIKIKNNGKMEIPIYDNNVLILNDKDYRIKYIKSKPAGGSYSEDQQKTIFWQQRTTQGNQVEPGLYKIQLKYFIYDMPFETTVPIQVTDSTS